MLKNVLKSNAYSRVFEYISLDNKKSRNPCLSRYFGLSWSLSDSKLVEAAATELDI